MARTGLADQLALVLIMEKAGRESLAWLATKLREPNLLDREEHVILTNELVKRMDVALPVDQKLRSSEHYYAAARLRMEMDQETLDCTHPLVARYNNAAISLARAGDAIFDAIKATRISSFRDVPNPLVSEFRACHAAFKAVFMEYQAQAPEVGYMRMVYRIVRLKQSITTLSGEVASVFFLRFWHFSPPDSRRRTRCTHRLSSWRRAWSSTTTFGGSTRARLCPTCAPRCWRSSRRTSGRSGWSFRSAFYTRTRA